MSPSLYWLASYPKSGNTWLRVFLTNLKSAADQPASINELDTQGIASGREWLDDVLGLPTADLTAKEVLSMRPHVYRWSSQSNTESRFIKVHDANVEVAKDQYLFPVNATAGVIYVIRNPLDVAISLAHHNATTIDKAIKRMNNPNNKLAKFTGKHQSIQVEQHLFSWSRHVESWIDFDRFDTLVIRYEDMQATPHKTFASAANHLGIAHDESSLARAIKHSSFDILRAQEEEASFQERAPKAESFFRKGTVGDWRDVLTNTQIDLILENHHHTMSRFGYLDDNNRPKNA